MRTRLAACVSLVLLCLPGLANLPAHAVAPASATTAPAAPTNFAGTLTGKIATMTWTNPTDPGLTGVVVRQNSGTTIPGPTVGALVADTMSQTATTTSLSAGTYTFAAYAHDATPAYSSPAAVWVVTVPPPPQVTSFTGTLLTPTSVSLTWVNPVSPILTGVTVRRYLPAAAISPTSGTFVADTLTQQATDPGLAPATTYLYAAFAHDAAGNYSLGRTWTARTSLTWGAPTVVDPVVGGPTAVSCATTTYCVAVDATGRALTFNGSTWTAPTKVLGADASGTADGFLSVDCPTVAFCAATTGTGRFLASHYGVWRAAPIPAAPSGGGWSALDCTSSTFCAALNGAGWATTFNGVGWRAPTRLGTAGIMWSDVSCASSSMCLAVGDAGSHVYTARLGGSSWTVTSPGRSTGDRWRVSCASTTFCMLVDSSGALRYNGALYAAVRPPALFSPELSCTSPTFCVAFEADGPARVARWDGTLWQGPVDAIQSADSGSGSLSCVLSMCLEIASYGWTSRTTGGAWSNPVYVDKTTGWLERASCASSQACEALDIYGNALRWNGASWSAPSLPVTSTSSNLACPTDTMCMVTDPSSHTYRTYSSGAWQPARSTSPVGLDLVDCVDASWCMASDTYPGAFHVWNGLTWGPGMSVYASNSLVTQLSCPTRTMCMALDATGKWTRWNGTSWSTPEVMDGGTGFFDRLDCPTLTMCVATDGLSGLFMGSDGLSFQGPSAMPAGNVVSLSCPTKDACYALDYAGGGQALPRRGLGTGHDARWPRDERQPTCHRVSDPNSLPRSGLNEGGVVELTVRGARQRILRLRLLACVAATVLGVAGQAALIPAHAVTPSATTTAPAPPTTFTGTLAGKIATMTWTNPTDPGLTGVVVRGLSGTTVPGPTVGALIADTLSQTATTPTLSTGTYTFAAYAHDATPTYSSPAAVWVVTVPPPPPVSNFLGTLVTPSSVKLTWVNPISPILTGVMVRRYLPSETVGLATGTLLTDTLTQQATDSGLAPAATYVYAAFAHDDAGHYSVPRTWTARTSLRWGAPTVVDHLVGGPTAVSCATTTYCVAVDATGRALTFNGSIWTAPAQVLGADASGTADGFLAVDCPTVAFCAATTGTGRFLVSHYGVWRAMPTPGSGGSWYALDCTSSTFCAAVNADGRVTTFNGTAWRAPTSLGTPGVVWRDVSCVSPTMCLAVAGAGRYVYTARLTGSTWAAQRVGAVAGDQWQVSCTSTTFCMMVGRSGLSLRYNGSTYVVIPDYQGDANEVSCTTPTSCVLVGFDATARWDGTAWSPLTHPVFPYSLGEAVSCVQSSCVVVSGFGWSTRLTGATWSVPTYVDKTAGRLAQVSCASTTACTALDDFGASVRWNGTSWTVPNGPISSPGGRLSCPTDAMCMLTDGQNEGYRTWSSGTWQAAKTTYPRQLDLVACADATWCMASDGQGQTHVWNGTSWGAGLTVPGETQWMSQLSCPSRTMCMALDPTGKWTRWNGTSWSVPAVMGNGMGFVDHLDCPSATMCMATDSSDRLYMVSDGLSFQGPSPMPAANVESLSCPTVDACYALSYDGGVTRFLDGQWAVDTTPGGLTAADSPMAIECPTRTACLEIGTTKAVWSS